MKLELSKEKAMEIYKDSPPWLQEILNETFGKDSFKKKDFTDIKTFKDACEYLGIDKESIINSNDTPDEAAYKKIKIIVKAINQGWTPDWANSNQYKWWPYFNLSSGFGFSYANDSYAYTVTFVGSRLCFESEAKAKYAGTQFIDFYKQFLK
jgi:hypothetical protein